MPRGTGPECGKIQCDRRASRFDTFQGHLSDVHTSSVVVLTRLSRRWHRSSTIRLSRGGRRVGAEVLMSS